MRENLLIAALSATAAAVVASNKSYDTGHCHRSSAPTQLTSIVNNSMILPETFIKIKTFFFAFSISPLLAKLLALSSCSFSSRYRHLYI